MAHDAASHLTRERVGRGAERGFKALGDGDAVHAAHLRLAALAKAEHLRLSRGSFQDGVALRSVFRRSGLSIRKVTPSHIFHRTRATSRENR